MTLTIPSAIGDVDAEFIDAALRAAGVLSGGAVIAHCDITYLGEGIGMLGDLARVAIEYSTTGAGPASFIVKMPTTHEANRNRGLAFAFYER